MKNARITIQYELEDNGEIKKKELPFVIGIMGDFAGNHSAYHKTDIRDREFICINKDNLPAVMAKLDCGLAFNTKNYINNAKSTLPISLSFRSLEDFKPESIIRQVPELRKLYELRSQLKELQLQSEYQPDLLKSLEKEIKLYLGEQND